MSYLGRAREVFDVEITALKAVKARLDADFDKAVQLVVETLRERGKIVIVGIGKSGNVGRKIAATLTSTGSTSVVLDSVDALHGDLGILNDGDAVLVLSYSGESEELVNLLPALKRFSVQMIAMSGAPKSTVASNCDIVLNVEVPEEACPFNLAPTASTTAMLAMGDALAMAVLEARGFKRSDFALRHPSGTIGRSLLLQVREIMRAKGRLPLAEQGMLVKEALLVMTKARAGSVCVVDQVGKLVGVFTDGDLRRHMANGDDVLVMPLSQVMTPDPICLQEDSLAVEALKIFNERSIDDLIVVNADRKPVGLVDSQDLPKLKLM